jgi:hypothetical protein
VATKITATKTKHLLHGGAAHAIINFADQWTNYLSLLCLRHFLGGICMEYAWWNTDTILPQTRDCYLGFWPGLHFSSTRYQVLKVILSPIFRHCMKLSLDRNLANQRSLVLSYKFCFLFSREIWENVALTITFV